MPMTGPTDDDRQLDDRRKGGAMALDAGRAVDDKTPTGTAEKAARADGAGDGREDEAEEATSSTTCAASGTSMQTALGQATVEKANDHEGWPERLRVELEGAEDPFHWPIRKKWVTAGIGCWFCFLAGLAGGALSATIPQLIEDLGTSREMGELALSIFPLGFGIAPLFLAPFSEAFGRLPVYHITFFIYLVFFVGIATARNIQTVIICRFIQGCAASTGSTMAAGTVADVFLSPDRGLPMSIFSLAAFAGVGSGPLCMAYVSQNVGWRWSQWVQMIVAGATFVVLVACMRETRGSVLVMRKARRWRREGVDGEKRWWAQAERERVNLATLVRVSSTKAIYMLISEPIVLAFSLWISFSWAVMWGLLSAINLILENVYGFSQGNAGLGFSSIVIGALIGVLTNPIQERLYARYQPTKGAEARLYSAMVGGLLLPIGGFIVGWTQGNGPWIAPLIGVTCLMCGVFQIYCSCFNFLADCYGLSASSAIAGQSFARNLAGAAFPLFTTQMYENLGYQWASTLIACIGLFGSVLPFVLYVFGPRIRARSKMASAILRAEEEARAQRFQETKSFGV